MLARETLIKETLIKSLPDLACIFMQCFVITRLAIRGGLFLTLHENTRAKSDSVI